MKSFFKIFFATLLALIIFVLLGFLILVGVVSHAVSSNNKITVEQNSVLVLNLDQPVNEQKRVNPLNFVFNRSEATTPGLHDMVALIHKAADDDNIKGIYLKLNGDPNGFATNEELRDALLDFRKSNKFIYAYGEVIPQKAYYVATTANKVYLNPQGVLDFSGLSVNIMFLKGLLDKLDIQPQIFYDGKFKSATEPLRVKQMTEANKIQTRAYLDDLYYHFLAGVGKQRNIDTATLFSYANEGLIQNANDALRYKLVDGLKYDDQVMDALRSRLALGHDEKINFISMDKYDRAVDQNDYNGDDRIAIVYAQGDIVTDASGNSSNSIQIASHDYIKLLRKLRQDKQVKAIVFRVNSPGGSALAADEIWREIALARKNKPVVVSMGDYAASGGYYISCNADSIFAEPNTLTGSIGVFGIIPNLKNFFNNKLGITFDGVKTAQYADLGNISRPLTETEQRFVQNAIDTIYNTFKTRVSNGRDLRPEYVDSIAQGRVWSGTEAVKIGLVDKLGNMNDAIACAARMAHLQKYTLREYPETKSTLEKIFGDVTNHVHASLIKTALNTQEYKMYNAIKKTAETKGEIEARLPFYLEIR